MLTARQQHINGSDPEDISSADPLMQQHRELMLQKATFGAGCFWGVEAAFRRTPGVVRTAVGYAGGTTKDPTYQDVCTDETGHAEVVEVVFDPAAITYDGLLDVFWDNHNPTTRNRQGPDIGSQYRSVIFCHDDDQMAVAKQSRAKKQNTLKRPIVTQIRPATPFYRAEEYHQRYLEKHGLTHCHIN